MKRILLATCMSISTQAMASAETTHSDQSPTVVETQAMQVFWGENDRLVIIPKTDVECFVAGPSGAISAGEKRQIIGRKNTLVCQPRPAPPMPIMENAK